MSLVGPRAVNAAASVVASANLNLKFEHLESAMRVTRLTRDQHANEQSLLFNYVAILQQSSGTKSIPIVLVI